LTRAFGASAPGASNEPIQRKMKMAGINKVIIVGRVGKDPETRNFPSGGEMAEFSIATSETWRDKTTGERKEKTEWHNIKILNDGLVKNVVRPYVSKGSLVGIEGELQTEQWEKNGEKRYSTKVVVGAFRGTLYLLGNKDDNGGGSRRDDDRGNSRSSGGSQGNRPGNGGTGGGSFSHDMDDDIPFAPEFR
jgi:single-strand DNA-binding protein